ncbi:MAG: Gfo/Idh/MocA family protein [Paracoccus sp. (in: a-proteobacteria)]|uniref:Gfo/Idh/MocA family protein n=1 Tax=Paracoccus sp. TaxID=267 RepID=UPI00391C136A
MTPIRLGMIGGGQGAFIGAVHRMAARLDGQYVLVAGALSSDPARAVASGAGLGLDPARCYTDFVAMAGAEAARPDGVEAVAIVTPNHLHAPAARAFLARGIHVICDKPLTATLDEALALTAEAQAARAHFVVTYTYSGYPMVRQARQMVADGALGRIRLVQVEYAQDWLTTPVETQGSKQAEWRADPVRAGLGGAVGDIGTHAFHLAQFVSGLRVERLAADLAACVPGRVLDDNGHILLRFEGGARGMLWCSQVAPGFANSVRIRIFGEDGGLDWCQDDANTLRHTPTGEATRLITRGGPGATQPTRVPAGHPEGYIEAFASVYADAAALIRGGAAPHLPLVAEGRDGVAFVAAAVESSRRDAAWVSLADRIATHISQ